MSKIDCLARWHQELDLHKNQRNEIDTTKAWQIQRNLEPSFERCPEVANASHLETRCKS